MAGQDVWTPPADWEATEKPGFGKFNAHVRDNETYLKARVDELFGSPSIRFNLWIDNTNKQLTAAFSDIIERQFVPPEDWDTYDILLRGFMLFRGQNTSSAPQLRSAVAPISTGVEVASQPLLASTTGTAVISLVAGSTFSALTGDIDVRLQAADPQGGSVEAAQLDLIARRTA